MMNPKVDFFFTKAKKWQPEFIKLRAIALSCGLAEELKWGQPCYTFEGRNIVLIHGFKEYCAFLFFKGVLIKDKSNLLVQQTANVQAARQARFTSEKEIDKLKKTLSSLIREAIELEKSGAKVPMKETKQFEIPDEFQLKLERSAKLKKAFTSLTPGRQRAYLLYFGAPKQSKTRETRIEKSIPKILNGKGLDDL